MVKKISESNDSEEFENDDIKISDVLSLLESLRDQQILCTNLIWHKIYVLYVFSGLLIASMSFLIQDSNINSIDNVQCFGGIILSMIGIVITSMLYITCKHNLVYAYTFGDRCYKLEKKLPKKYRKFSISKADDLAMKKMPIKSTSNFIFINTIIFILLWVATFLYFYTALFF